MLEIIEINILTLIIALVIIFVIILVLLQSTKNKYETRLKNLQDEAMLRLKALNEKIELNHNSYEDQINSLNTSNRKLQEEKKLIKETLEDKILLLEKHQKINEKNIIDNYELKLKSLSGVHKEKEKNFNEQLSILKKSKNSLNEDFEPKLIGSNTSKQLNLNQALVTFKDQLDSLDRGITTTYPKETGERTKLLAEIKDLYEWFAVFVTDIENIGINISRTQNSYKNAINRLVSKDKATVRKKQEEDYIEADIES